MSLLTPVADQWQCFWAQSLFLQECQQPRLKVTSIAQSIFKKTFLSMCLILSSNELVFTLENA